MYDSRIALSEIKLYDIFGLDHGKQQLEQYFPFVQRLVYEDSLTVTDAKDLMAYIYSCHGNQRYYLKGCTKQFADYVNSKVGKKGFHITKEAGLFICTKER